ncbi:MAG: putative glycolipid-binding domain-containing protein [Thermoleophilaceae bacterium]|nr:putative glycolipid-binding domain-containing protein [Thermoleophilaceae bacterium]
MPAWRHADDREGFEVLLESPGRFSGQTTGVEDGVLWALRYEIEHNGWVTESGIVEALADRVRVDADGLGAWRVDGEPRPDLDGCLDLDLEASACTNALPVRRLALEPGQRADAPAAWVRIPDLRVERLEQTYLRLPDEDGRSRYEYEAPDLGFGCVIVFDADGLTRDYPGIGARVA